MKKIFVLAACLIVSVSAFAFSAGMRTAQVSAEIAKRSAAGETSREIIEAARAAGVNPAVLQVSMLGRGFDPKIIFASMVAAGYAPDDLLPPTAASRGNEGGEGRREFGESRAGRLGATGGCRSASCS